MKEARTRALMAEPIDGKAAQVGPFKRPRKFKTRSHQGTNGGVLRSRCGDTYKLPCPWRSHGTPSPRATRARVIGGVARVTAAVRFGDEAKAEHTRRVQMSRPAPRCCSSPPRPAQHPLTDHLIDAMSLMRWRRRSMGHIGGHRHPPDDRLLWTYRQLGARDTCRRPTRDFSCPDLPRRQPSADGPHNCAVSR